MGPEMSSDAINANVNSTPFQSAEDGISMMSLSSKNPQENLHKEMTEEMSEEEILKLYYANERNDLMKTEELPYGVWNEIKPNTNKDGKGTMYAVNQELYKTRKILSEMESRIGHVTKDGINVGIRTLFIMDEKKRLRSQLEIALLRSSQRVEQLKKSDEGESAVKLMHEAIKLRELLKHDLEHDATTIRCIADNVIGKWMIAAINESNKKLAIFLNNEINYVPLNQLLNKTLGGGEAGDGTIPKNTFDYALGIGDGAVEAIKIILNGSKKPSYEEFEKQLRDLNNTYLDFGKMGEAGNLAVQLSNIRDKIYELEMLREELIKIPKNVGLICEVPGYFSFIIRKLNDPSNPTMSHHNYLTNQVHWQFVTREATQKNLNARNQPMLPSEREKHLEDLMAQVIVGGNMIIDKKKPPYQGDGGAGGGGGGKPILNINRNNAKKSRRCANVMRKGFCTRRNCQYSGVTKEEHDAIKECPFLKEGQCKFPSTCQFKHPGDKYDSSKSCVHRGSINNTNVGAAEEDKTKLD